MFKSLEAIFKNLEGNVLTVCIDQELNNELEKNNKINLYAINSNQSNKGLKSSHNRSSKKINNKGKKINIKKLRKYINKKSVDYMFCNMNEMITYYKYFIRDSIYLNNNKLYIYSDFSIDPSFIIKKYKRYNCEVEKREYKNGYLLIIDNTKSKNNYMKDKLYFLRDTLYNIAELIGNIMVS